MYDQQANTFFNRSLDSLSHYGVQGMKWGVRNEETLRKYNGGTGRRGSKDKQKASFGTKRKARKDSKEYARAKMFYGEGAGNRRKLIKATVEQRSKDLPGYKEEFDRNLEKQDMAKHASAAKKERAIKTTAKKTKQTARGLVHLAMKSAVPVSAAAVIVC